MVLTFGLSSPVPQTISAKPAKNDGVVGSAIAKWPSMISTPPKSTAR
jgi:hypothetical protein